MRNLLRRQVEDTSWHLSDHITKEEGHSLQKLLTVVDIVWALVRATHIQMFFQLLSSYVNVDMVLNLSEPQFLHLPTGANSNSLSESL